MTRNDILEILGADADKEIVTKLLDKLHAEIQTHKESAEKYQKDAQTAADALAEKAKELETLTKNATDAEALKKQVADWQQRYEADTKAAAAKLEAVEFDRLLDAAVLTAKPRSQKAAELIKKSLDLDALKASKNRDTDIAAAVKALAEDADTAMLFASAEKPAEPEAPKPTGEKANVGAPTTGSAATPDYSKMDDATYYAEMAKQQKS